MERHLQSVIGKTKTLCSPAMKDNVWLCMVKPLKCTSSKVCLLLRTERNTVVKKKYTTGDSLGSWGPGFPHRPVPGTLSGPCCLCSWWVEAGGDVLWTRELHFQVVKLLKIQRIKKGRNCLGHRKQALLSTMLKVVEVVLTHRGGGDSVGEARTACCVTGTHFLFPMEKDPLLGLHGTGLPKPKKATNTMLQKLLLKIFLMKK